MLRVSVMHGRSIVEGHEIAPGLRRVLNGMVSLLASRSSIQAAPECQTTLATL